MHYQKKIALTAIAAAAMTLCAAISYAQQKAATPAKPARAARIAGQPNINGVWQAMNSANWTLEAHSAEALKGFWQLGSLAAIPAGQSVIDGDGKVPYKPDALAKRDANRAGWPKSDPETNCYLPGIPRATYMPFPFQIIQGNNEIIIAYPFASASRIIHMTDVGESPADAWMGWSRARWEGDTLVVNVTNQIDQTWFDRAGNFHSEALTVVERYSPVSADVIQYEATMTDPKVFTRPWKISLPLYRHLEKNAQVLEFKCVPFAEELVYGHLRKK